MDKTGLARGRRVADLCTGSGVVAIAAADQGAAAVTCIRHLSARSAFRSATGCGVRSRRGRPSRLVGPCRRIRALRSGGLQPAVRSVRPSGRRSRRAVAYRAAVRVGRRLRRPTRARSVVRVDAEPARRSAEQCCSCSPSSPNRERHWRRCPARGLDAEILAWQWIPFGPVLSARAQWLEDTGRLEPGRREEELVVIRADRA